MEVVVPAVPAAAVPAVPPPPRQASKAKPGRSTPKAIRQAEAVRKARAKVTALHAEWRAALKQHGLQVEARFQAVQTGLAATTKESRPRQKNLEAIEDLAAGTRLKPGKGRLRDLRRVDEVLKAMLAELPD